MSSTFIALLRGIHGGANYLACPNGVGRSKLTSAWFDTKLATVSTAPNWNTVL